MADAYDLDERLPDSLVAAQQADYPRMSDKRRRSLLAPAIQDLAYYAPKPRGGDDMPRSDHWPPGNTVHDDRRQASDLEEDIQANVRAIRREADGRPKLDRLAELLDSLTYGEMMEFAQGCLQVKDYKPPGNEYDWASVMHRWCTERGK